MSVVRYEESYSIDSDLSEDDCRADTPVTATITTTQNNSHHDLNESLPIDIDIDTQNIDPTHHKVSTYSENTKTMKSASSHTSHTSTIRSTSMDISIEKSNDDTPLSHGRERNKTIEIYSEEVSNNWKYSGRCYRLCCYSVFGIKLIIILNILMILLNSGLIINEVVLILQQHTVMHTKLPLWYMIVDFIVTTILAIEMLFCIAAIYKCNLCKYFKSGWECWIDIIVLLLSVGCCAAYYFDLTNADIDNLTMLLVRVIRDIIRILRCLWFFKMLYTNLIRLGVRKQSLMSFRGEPLLAIKKLQYSSNKTKDGKQKSKNKNKSRHIKTDSMYSQHSNTSHRRNVTRNCDEWSFDNINDIIGSEGIEHIEGPSTMASDDKSVISINSQVCIPGKSKERAVIHRQMPTQIVDLNHNFENSYSKDEHSLVSGVTASTDMTYWENLKLRHVKKKTVDTQRLKDLLNNLPSGSIIDRESFSVDCDENEVVKQQLHAENDTITFI